MICRVSLRDEAKGKAKREIANLSEEIGELKEL